MKNPWTLLAIGAFLSAAPVVAAPPSTVTAKWTFKTVATATENASTERGSKSLPLEGASECLSRFKVTAITFTVDGTNLQEVAKFMAGKGSLATIEIRVSKLVSGRMSVPEVVISDSKNRHRFPFEINANSWPKAGYRFGGYFEGDKIAFPQHWTGVEIICPNP